MAYGPRPVSGRSAPRGSVRSRPTAARGGRRGVGAPSPASPAGPRAVVGARAPLVLLVTRSPPCGPAWPARKVTSMASVSHAPAAPGHRAGGEGPAGRRGSAARGLNRLAVRGGPLGPEPTFRRTVGGLVSGVEGYLRSRAGGGERRVGRVARGRGDEEGRRMRDERSRGAAGRVARVPRAREVARYYDGFCNGTLWPLFHYLARPGAPRRARDWAAYARVNERFADMVAERSRPGDTVWVHDYHLLLAARAAPRSACPARRSAFFLHVPFPPSEMFRILPVARARSCAGMLGADLVGFHTAALRAELPALGRRAARPRGRTATASRSAGASIARRRVPDRHRRRRLRGARRDRPRGRAARAALARRARGRASSCSASIASTTRRGSRAAPARSSGSSSAARAGAAASASSRSPCRRASDVGAYRGAARRGRARLVGRVNGRFGAPRWTPDPLPVPRARRRDAESRSTAPPT